MHRNLDQIADESGCRQRIGLRINGIVQGVGFRPFVYRLANELQLCGFVRNDSKGVEIEIEGAEKALGMFHRRLTTSMPAMARITTVDSFPLSLRGDRHFVIDESQSESGVNTCISPDIAVCAECLSEMREPGNRRFAYPFINCTNCGPRFTIVDRIPYDRDNTSMRKFVLCPECRAEYDNPSDRRFHAQPNACPICGPQVWLEIKGERVASQRDAVSQVIYLLARGAILAIKGLGGFHLAVDPFNAAAVQELRIRKNRVEKPFALMAADLDTVRQFCRVSNREAELLQDPARPIVLLDKLPDCSFASWVAPGANTLGWMLPYTALHHLLLAQGIPALVMTSGNLAEEPIVTDNVDARNRLSQLVDGFLMHDRDIRQRCDDSVMRVTTDVRQHVRRSRGFVPSPILLGSPTAHHILACGGEMKNCVALSRGDTVFLSQHIGDLDNPSAYDFFQKTVVHLKRLFAIDPEIIACDLHPEYLSTKWARQQHGVRVIPVQHHHAHFASVLAEHELNSSAIGIILDGTGFGSDGTIWGGEVIYGGAAEFTRHAWLEPIPMPGGTAAIRHPWRMALAHMYRVFGADVAKCELQAIGRRTPQEIDVLLRMIDTGVNCPLTSSCGRLFDAVASMLDVREDITYDAQAAIELETLALSCPTEEVEYVEAVSSVAPSGPLALGPLMNCIVRDIRSNVRYSAIASRFHHSVVAMFLRAAEDVRKNTGMTSVVLSGGCMHNRLLLDGLRRQLSGRGFEVFTNQQVPPNDGGLALGQILVADAIANTGTSETRQE
ncbi:MAG: carbamoyltransferase HypF [candidate division Zixibacteria bacterium]|nr:carbamoyltransferase HypF [candidate division Zixibacteria bacterium]